MPAPSLRNNATSRLQDAINAAQTTIVVINADRDKFPDPVDGEWFPVTVQDIFGNMEIMRCTDRSGASLTVARAQEGTAARSFIAGSRVTIRLTEAAFDAAFEQDNMRGGNFNKNFTVEQEEALAQVIQDVANLETSQVAPTKWVDPVVLRCVVAGGTFATDFEPGVVHDNVELQDGWRIFIVWLDNEALSGLYEVQAAGAPLRLPEADSEAELQGIAFLVSDGDEWANTQWALQYVDPIVVNTTPLHFSNIGIAPVGTEEDPDNLVTAYFHADRRGRVAWSVKHDGTIQTQGGAHYPLEEHSDDAMNAWVQADMRGRVAIAVRQAGSIHTQGGDFFPDEVDSTDLLIAFARCDLRGRILFSIHHDGSIHTCGVSIWASGGGGGSGAFSDDEIKAYDAWTLAMTALVVANGNPALQKFVAGRLAHVVEYGQSLSIGTIAHPVRTTDPFDADDAVMLGLAVAPKNATATFDMWSGAPAALNPLQANVRGVVGGGTVGTVVILSDAEVEALPWMDTAVGEVSGVGFVAFLKWLWLQHANLDTDTTRKFVLTATGRGGTNALELAPGTNYYERTVDGADQIDGLDPTAYHFATLHTQGEADAGEGTPKATFKTRTLAIFDGFDADIGVGVYGQSKKAVKLINQTSGKWVFDATDMAVQVAQLELNKERNDVFVVGPTALYTNKTEAEGHLDANGTRWMGLMAAKVAFRTAIKGEGWLPLCVRRAVTRSGAVEVLVMYHVPAPPLIRKSAFVGFTPTDFEFWGFSVKDNSGIISVTSVAIVGDGTIKLTIARPCATAPFLLYGGQATNGTGNVHDSDRLEAIFDYEYLPAAGDDATANVASLVDLPYPLNNMACSERIAIDFV